MSKELQVSPRVSLRTILSLNQASSPDMSEVIKANGGIYALAEAYIQGYTSQDIADYFKVNGASLLAFEYKLPAEDKVLLRYAKMANLEQLEHHLLGMMWEKLGDEVADIQLGDKAEGDESGASPLDAFLDRKLKASRIRGEDMSQVERILLAAQRTLERYRKDNEKVGESSLDSGVKVLVVSPDTFNLMVGL